MAKIDETLIANTNCQNLVGSHINYSFPAQSIGRLLVGYYKRITLVFLSLSHLKLTLIRKALRERFEIVRYPSNNRSIR